MALSIQFTPEAEETLEAIYNFIERRFGLRSADKFAMKSARVIDLITMQPFMFKPLSIDENVRVGFITKQCSLVYRVTDTEIHLLYFWDNRQEPILL